MEKAARHMEDAPISLCAWNADRFGRFWYEGPHFLEALFRHCGSLQFMTPSEYLADQNPGGIEQSVPAFSSWGADGYAGSWLDASSDWMYRHISRAVDRMVEMAERFPGETGLKERALNQAARELLLAQDADWPMILSKSEGNAYTRGKVEDALRNFTTIYEALGGGYISTEWLTGLERRHNVFPHINYRVFKRSK
jgi:1,4-alpha-glucan branching enzyme